MSKIKLSETLRFLTARLNAVTGGDVELRLEIDEEEVPAGEAIHARARVRSPQADHRLDYLRITMKGQVQREGRWREYVQSAEVAHETDLPADHEYVVPIVIVIPADAVLTEDGGIWSLRAQAFIDRKLDPRAEAAFAVIAGAPADADDEEEE